MSELAQEERQALCDTFDQVGPNAPTLCEGWTTADLAAHLIIRERRPDALAGAFIPALAGRTKTVQGEYARRPWAEVVDLVRSGPPIWAPTRLRAADEAVNLAEFFVHHEDVLRAQPGWTADHARDLPRHLVQGLWTRLKTMGPLLYRKADVGIALVAPMLGRRTVHAQTKAGSVVLTGAPGELVLYSFGRKSVAQVDVFGAPEAVARLDGLSLGI
ncbi:MAG TPA: TIGR03085 family metal-binding protein [Dermatophilaceae bacterium]|nr:TIGR03085 family metal-binding protein [Dermatophilaceae bacterium]